MVPALVKVVEGLEWVIQRASEGVRAIREFKSAVSDFGLLGPMGLIPDKSAGQYAGDDAKNAAEEMKRQRMQEFGKNIVEITKEEDRAAKDAAKQAKENEREVARAMQERVDAAKHHADEMARIAKRLSDEAMNPMEKFKARLKEIKAAMDEHLISFRQYEQLAAKAGAEVEKSFGKHKDISESMRAGISAADISTSGGAAMDLAAGRALQDIQLKSDTISLQQLESLQRIEGYTKAASEVAGRQVSFGIADL